jgi:hypothetical protein
MGWLTAYLEFARLFALGNPSGINARLTKVSPTVAVNSCE